MKTPSAVALHLTAPSPEELTDYCRRLLVEKLAASANIIPTIHSVYWWNLQLQEHPESLAILHTLDSLIPDIEVALNAMHPYEVPQFVYYPLHASAAYLDWIIETTRQDSTDGHRGS